jgi:phage terminase Nu1 subunit (DNA packaging protein)
MTMTTPDRLHTGAELAALLRCSERTVARLVIDGMPSILVRGRRVYDAAECLRWMRERDAAAPCPSDKTQKAAGTLRSASVVGAFTDACRRAQLRVMPSSPKLS